MKKIFLIIMLILPITMTTVFASFSDVKSTDWYYEDVMTLKNAGIVSGGTDGKYYPTNNVTNGEILKMVSNVFGFSGDTSTSGHWAMPYYEYALTKNIVTSSFDVNTLGQDASRMFVAECIYNALNVGSVNSLTPFADVDSQIANTLYHLGITKGVTVGKSLYFYPNNAVSRAEATSFIARSMAIESKKMSISKTPYIAPNPVVTNAPKTLEDYEQVLIYMGVNNIENLKLTYSDTGFKDLSQYYRYVLPAFESVFEKYPEIFTFANELSFGGSGTDTESELIISLKSYYFDKTTSNSLKSSFISECENVVYILRLAGTINDNMSQYNKAKAIFEWLVLNKSYDENYRDVSYTGYGISEYNTGVCQSYVANLNLMLKLVGINAVGVSGKAGNVDHMWSYAYLDGRWVYMDPTYADPIPDTKGYCDFYYFDISEANLLKTHTF